MKSGVALTFIFMLLTALCLGSALAAECASAPIHADTGTYKGCEIVHGSDVQFRGPDDIAEAACPQLCEAVGEVDELAAESKELDSKAGF